MKKQIILVAFFTLAGGLFAASEASRYEMMDKISKATDLFNDKKYSEALPVISKAIEMGPNGKMLAQCLLIRGLLYVNLRKIDKGVDDFDRGIGIKEIQDSEIQTNFYLSSGSASIMRYDFKKGENNLKTAYERDKKDFRTCCMLGIMEQMRGNYAQSLEYYGKARVLDVQGTAPLFGMGDIQRLTGKYAEAKSTYKQALVLDGKRGEADMGYCEVLYEEGNIDKALKLLSDFPDYYDDVVKLKSKLIMLRALHEKGMDADCARLLTETEEGFGIEMKKNPRNHELYNYLAELYCDLGVKNDKATELAQTSVKLMPCGISYAELGRCYLEKGDLAKAKEYLPRFMEVNPNLPAGYHYLGILYKRLGDKVKAAEALNKGLKINPNNRFLKKELQEL